jgi:lysozyme
MALDCRSAVFMGALELIQKHEGLRLKPYDDGRGNTTIGWGRNLSGRGITFQEAQMLLAEDYRRAQAEATRYPYFQYLGEPRQAVILDMVFNLGALGYSEFYDLHAALDHRDYDSAAAAMLNSSWARQVGDRAIEDAQIMSTGQWARE